MSTASLGLPFLVLVSCILGAALDAGAAAAPPAVSDKADFSGTWQVDLAKSSVGNSKVPPRWICIVAHKDPNVEVTWEGDEQKQKQTLRYTTDGEKHMQEVTEGELALWAEWEGAELRLASHMQVGREGAFATERWRLSDDGKVLTITRDIGLGTVKHLLRLAKVEGEATSASIPTDRYIALLVSELQHKEREIRVEAARSLGVLGDTRAIDALGKALGDEDTSVGSEASIALGRIKDPRAVEVAVAALQGGGNRNSRLYAAYALRSLGEPSTKDALVAALQDPDHNVRRTAVEALATFQDPRFIDLFIRLTKEPGGDTSIRRESTRALTAIQEPRSTEFLLECVRDFDTEVRQLAIRELGRRKERRAVPALIESLSDKEWGVRFAARSALAGISGQAFGDDAKKWQSWWSKQSKQ